jgi:hypothetical protein
MSHLKGKLISHQLRNARRRSDERQSFTHRNVYLWVFLAWVVYPCGVLLSGFTEGFFIHSLAARFSAPVAWGFTALAVLAIEGLIYFLGKTAIDDVQAGVFSGTLTERAMFALKALGFVACFALSVHLSLRGAPLFQEWHQRSADPVALRLEDEGQIERAYADDKAVQLDIIAGARATTWRGSITRPAMASLRTAQAELARIDAAIAADRERVRQRNAAAVDAYEAEVAAGSRTAFSLAGLGQGVVLLCIILIGLYDQGVDREVGARTQVQAEPGNDSEPAAVRPFGSPSLAAASVSSPLSPPTHPRPRPIGFRTYGDAPPTPLEVPPISDGSVVDTLTAPALPAAAPTVATSSHDGAGQDLPNPELDQQTRLNSYRALMKTLRTYQSRDTAAAHEARAATQRHLDYEVQQLARLGKRIELREKPVRKYVLVDIAPPRQHWE